MIEKTYEAEDLDGIFEILDETDEIENLDDSSVMNEEADEEPEEVNIEYVLIHDENGTKVYRDEDFEE